MSSDDSDLLETTVSGHELLIGAEEILRIANEDHLMRMSWMERLLQLVSDVGGKSIRETRATREETAGSGSTPKVRLRLIAEVRLISKVIAKAEQLEVAGLAAVEIAISRGFEEGGLRQEFLVNWPRILLQ